jgi:hypothetical protein
MRGGIFPGRAKFYRVPAVSRHGGTVTALLRLAKCSLVNKLVWTSQAKDLSFLKRTANMQFWRIFNPDYESDYQHSYINGGLEHPFGMPGIECDVCHQTWGVLQVTDRLKLALQNLKATNVQFQILQAFS